MKKKVWVLEKVLKTSFEHQQRTNQGVTALVTLKLEGIWFFQAMKKAGIRGRIEEKIAIWRNWEDRRSPIRPEKILQNIFHT